MMRVVLYAVRKKDSSILIWGRIVFCELPVYTTCWIGATGECDEAACSRAGSQPGEKCLVLQ
jgi:hypothetical protein